MPYDLEPEGTYSARPISGTVSETPNGTPQMVVDITITHIADATVDTGWTELPMPIVRKMYLYLSTGAYERTRKDLEALGFDGNHTTPGFNSDNVSVNCKHDTYKDQTRERWSLGGGSAKPLETSQLDVLQARWKNDHPAPVATGAPPPAPAPAGASPAKPTGDDIPF